jgi:hypothetical protein
MTDSDNRDAAGVALYWLPLGAGGRFVGWNGRRYEALAARREHRARAELYHSALEVSVDGARFTIEMTPVVGSKAPVEAVVQHGPVGYRWLGHLRLFRYEVRRWRDGTIPDVADAVGSPLSVSRDPASARRLLELVPQVPALTWGRDESHVGEMWNSNSITAWLLARAHEDVASIAPPAGGRAPGWRAGLIVAADHVPRPDVSEPGVPNAYPRSARV